MNNLPASGVGKSNYVNPYKKEVVDLVNKSGGLFAGHKITWTVMGDSTWERVMNYCKACLSKDFREAVREAFINHLKSDIEEMVALHETWQSATGLIKGEVDKTLFEGVIKKIMSIDDSNVSKAKKMELILSAVKDNALFSEITEVKAAKEYFKQEKEKIRDIIEERMPRGHDYELANLERFGEFDKKEISSEQGLKDFQKEYIGALIDERMKECKNDIGLLRKLEETVTVFFDKPGILVEKNARSVLLAPIREKLISAIGEGMKNNIMNSVEQMLGDEDTKSALKAIRTQFEDSKVTLKTVADARAFRLEYTRSAITVMVEHYRANEAKLENLRQNVIKLLNTDRKNNVIWLLARDKLALTKLVTDALLKVRFG